MQSPATASMCHFKDRNKHTTPQPRRAFLKWKFCGARFSRCKQSWQAKTSPKQQSSAPLAECQTDGTFFLKPHSFDSWKGTNGQIVLFQSWQFLFSFLMKQLWRARCLCAIWWCKNIYRSKKWTFLSVKKERWRKRSTGLHFVLFWQLLHIHQLHAHDFTLTSAQQQGVCSVAAPADRIVYYKQNSQ